MQVLDDSTQVADRSDRALPSWPGLTAVLVAVAFGLLIGLWIGRDDPSVIVVPEGAELTERQAEMLEVVRDYGEAWRANDIDAMASRMTPNAVVRYPENGWEFRPSDGTLEAWIAHPRYRTLQFWSVRVVDESRVVLFGEVESEGVRWISIIELTPTGDPLVVRESIEWWI